MESNELLTRHLVVEGHRDVYELLYRRSLGEANPLRDVIAPRLVQNRVDVSVFAISGDSYSHSQDTGRYLETALENLDMFLEEAPKAEGMISLIRSKSEIPEQVHPGRVFFLLHFEGGKPLQGSIHQIRNFYRMGVRSIQPTWNLRNELGDGVWETETKGRLTQFGIAVIKEMSRLGMVVDLAHMNREGFFHSLEVAEAPLIVSHANACGIFEHPRNLSDEQIKALASQGGFVGVSMIPGMVSEKDQSCEDVLNHLDHMVELVGPEHVGLGFDFIKYDGPRTLRDRIHPKRQGRYVRDAEEVEDLPKLVDGLIRRGYKEADIALILGQNYIRVLKEILPDQPVI